MPPRLIHLNRFSSLRPPRAAQLRLQSSSPNPSSEPKSKHAKRLSKLLAKLPTSPSLNRLRNQPISHVISFLILHEITAIVPLFGLATALHYAPDQYSVQRWENIPFVEEGKQRMWRMGIRRGWVEGDADEREKELEEGARSRHGWGCVVMELAVAWAVTKALLPARIALSVWATPWFARKVFGPVEAMLKGKKAVKS